MSIRERAEAALLEVTYDLAHTYYHTQDWANAVEQLREVIERDPNYKDAAVLLEKSQDQLKLASLYDQAQQALTAEDWETVRDRCQEILEIDSNYKNANDLYDQAHKEIELPRLYTQVSEQLHHQQWSEAIETLTAILDLEPDYKDASLLLEQTKQREEIERAYQLALKQYEKAKQTEQEAEWQEVAILLQEIVDKEPGYKTVSAELAHAQKRLAFFELSRQGKKHYANEEWQQAVIYLEQATKLDSQNSDLAAMLAEAREKLQEQKAARRERQQRTLVAVLAVLAVVLATVALFLDQLAPIRYTLAQMLGAEPPGLDRIEIFLNGSPIDRKQPLDLVGSKAVMLEVFVVDENGRAYTGNELKCTWSVAPAEAEGIVVGTDQCKTLYEPSPEYPSQTIVLKISGREQQFKPDDPISLKFNITQATIATPPTYTPTTTCTPIPTYTKSPSATPTSEEPTTAPTSAEPAVTQSLTSTIPITPSPTITNTPTPTPTPTATSTPTPTPTSTFTPTPFPLKLAYIVAEEGHTLFLANLTNLEIVNADILVPLRAASPTWSPYGERIAFLGEVGIEYVLPNAPGGSGLWIYDLETNRPTLLREDDKAKYLTWSPDGGLIAYESTKDTGESRIFFLDTAGQERPGNIRGEQPAWSPDNSRIVMKACREGGCGLWTVDLDGLTPQHITFHNSDSFPNWWGNQIVFTSQQGGNWDIYRVTLDEIGRPQGNPEQLTIDPAHDTTPVYSPDGRFIFFRSNRDNRWAIWVMNADGTDQQSLIVTDGTDAWNREKISVIEGVR